MIDGTDETGPVPCPAAGRIESGGGGGKGVEFVRRDYSGGDGILDPSANHVSKPDAHTEAGGGGERGDIGSDHMPPRRGQGMAAGNEICWRGDETDE